MAGWRWWWEREISFNKKKAFFLHFSALKVLLKKLSEKEISPLSSYSCCFGSVGISLNLAQLFLLFFRFEEKPDPIQQRSAVFLRLTRERENQATLLRVSLTSIYFFCFREFALKKNPLHIS
jgi:hypothetical protein